MHLLTTKEIDRLKSADVKVILDDRSNRDSIILPERFGKTLVAFRGKANLYGDECGKKLLTTTNTIEYLVLIDGVVLDQFTARTGSWDKHGERWCAGFIRRRALKRALRVLGV